MSGLLGNSTSDTHVSDSSYLAAERTYLAWVRTSLALLGLGLVIARYLATTYNKVKVSTILAFVSFTSSIFFLAFATYRYFTVIDEMGKDSFEVDKVGPAFMCAFTAAILLVSAVVMWRLTNYGEIFISSDNNDEDSQADFRYAGGDPDERELQRHLIENKSGGGARTREMLPPSDVDRLLRKMEQLIDAMARDHASR